VTVETTTARVQYDTNGTTGPWTVPFYFLADADISVFYADAAGAETELTLSTNYSVTGAGDPNGGTVTTVTAYAAGGTITVIRSVEALQETHWLDTDPFPAPTIERSFDRLTQLAQQLLEVQARSIVVAPSDEVNVTLPTAAVRANRLLAFDSLGGVTSSAAPTGTAASVLADLINTTNNALNDALIGVKRTVTGAVATTQHAWNEAATYDVVRDFGAVGDGATSDTTAIQSAIDNVPTGSTLVFRGGKTFKHGQLIVNGKNLTIFAMGATFTLVGDNAGWLVKGTVTQFDVYGGVYNGDNTNRDADSTKAQIAWSFGNESGAQVSNCRVYGAYINQANQGIRFSDGRGGGGTPTTNCHAYGCVVKGSVGAVGGTGYGFHFALANGSGITGCVADGCGRHGVYFAQGKGYTATDIQVRNCGSGAAVRGSFAISRSAQVAVAGLVCESNLDVGLVIDTDSQGLAPDNVLNGVIVSGYESYDNSLGDIQIATSTSPSTDGVPTNVTIDGATIRVKASSTNSSVVVKSCAGLVMKGLNIDASGAGASQRAIALTATGGATYSADIVIEADRIKTTGTGFGIQVESAIATGTQSVNLNIKQLTGGGTEYDFVGGEDAATNNNMTYRKSSGRAGRTYSSSGSLITIPVGGITDLTFSPSGATTVSQFSGGVEGARIDLFFTNANTTLKATNFYLAGAVDFVSTAHDCLSMQYRGGAWRERSRSVN
jgi:hypothetical protein